MTRPSDVLFERDVASFKAAEDVRSPRRVHILIRSFIHSFIDLDVVVIMASQSHLMHISLQS